MRARRVRPPTVRSIRMLVLRLARERSCVPASGPRPGLRYDLAVMRKLAPVALLVLVLSGCTSAPGHPAADASLSPSPSPSPSPTVSIGQLKSWVDAAGLTPAVVGATKPVNDDTKVANALEVCGNQLVADINLAYLHYWRWAGSHLSYVEHTVEAYQGIRGVDVIAEIKGREHDCTSYEETDPYGTAELTPAGDYAFTLPHGVDSGYAYCVLTTMTAPAKNKGEKDWICTGTLVRGDVVVIVSVFSGQVPSLASSQHNLDVAIVAAAAALAHAIPTDYQ
jgi:hypothetical protein